MEDDIQLNFDLLTLLRLGDLDIRGVLRNNLKIRASRYFGLLSAFANHAPPCIDSINKIVNLEGNDEDYENLDIAKELLGGIGYFKIIPDIEEILKVGKRGRAESAADGAKRIKDDFSRLYTRIMAAERPGKPETTEEVQNEDGTPAENSEPPLLKNILLELEQEEATRKLRILAVDDSPVMLKTVSSILSDEYKVYGMPNPKMLENFLKQISPDLFLLDYEMPEINGFELIPVIRSFEEHKDTPIIFLTSLGTGEHVSTAHALGASDFVVKPFQGDNLREKIAKHIVRKKIL